MVKVLAIGHARNGIGWEHIAPYVGEEARSVWELHESGRARTGQFVSDVHTSSTEEEVYADQYRESVPR